MWPTLVALKDSDGSASNQELLTRVIQILNLPEEIQNLPHGKGPATELEYRLQWARVYLARWEPSRAANGACGLLLRRAEG